MFSTTQKINCKSAATGQTAPKVRLKATWVVENNRLVCKWLAA